MSISSLNVIFLNSLIFIWRIPLLVWSLCCTRNPEEIRTYNMFSEALRSSRTNIPKFSILQICYYLPNLHKEKRETKRKGGRHTYFKAIEILTNRHFPQFQFFFVLPYSMLKMSTRLMTIQKYSL